MRKRPTEILGRGSPRRSLTQGYLKGRVVSDGQRAAKSRNLLRATGGHPLRRDGPVPAVLSKARPQAAVPTLRSVAAAGQRLPAYRTAAVPALHDGRRAGADLGHPHPGLQPLLPAAVGAEPLSGREHPAPLSQEPHPPGTAWDQPRPRFPSAHAAPVPPGPDQRDPGPGFDRPAPVWLDDPGGASRVQSQEAQAPQLPPTGGLRGTPPRDDPWDAATGGYPPRQRGQTVLQDLSDQVPHVCPPQTSQPPGAGRRGILRQGLRPVPRRATGWLRHRREDDRTAQSASDRAAVPHVSPAGPLAGRPDPLPADALDLPPSLHRSPASQAPTARHAHAA